MSTNPPEFYTDTQATLNPYEVPRKLWSILQPYFEKKYNVEISDSFPQKLVDKNIIVWNIFRKIPGGGKFGRTNSQGANFTRFLPYTPDGMVQEMYTHLQTVWYDFSVFSYSTEVVEQLAWDLELAVLEVAGILQAEYPGLILTFAEQMTDTTLTWKSQDELIRRVIRFRAEVPIRFVRLVPELRYIEVKERIGRVPTIQKLLTRTTAASTYYVPVQGSEEVVEIYNVYMPSSNGLEGLIKDTDYYVKYDSNQIAYIEWNDEFGRVPAVGEEFRVDYSLAGRINIRTVSQPPNE